MSAQQSYDQRLRAARERIDALDDRLIALLTERAALAADIGRLRRECGHGRVGATDRGAQVLARFQAAEVPVTAHTSVTLESIGLAILEHSAGVQRAILEAAQP